MGTDRVSFFAVIAAIGLLIAPPGCDGDSGTDETDNSGTTDAVSDANDDGGGSQSSDTGDGFSFDTRHEDPAPDTLQTKDTGSGDDGESVVKGACCRNEDCVVSTQTHCERFAVGDSFHQGKSCGDNPCSFETGACCGLGACDDTLSDSCENTFKSGTTCSTDPCQTSTGACCMDDGSCVYRTESRCQRVGGTYHDGAACSDHPC